MATENDPPAEKVAVGLMAKSRGVRGKGIVVMVFVAGKTVLFVMIKNWKPFMGDACPRRLVDSMSWAAVRQRFCSRAVSVDQWFWSVCIRTLECARKGDALRIVVGRGRTILDFPPATNTTPAIAPEIADTIGPVRIIAIALDDGF